MDVGTDCPSDALIVTSNAVEAADLSEALTAAGRGRVSHVKNTQAGVGLFEAGQFAPKIAVVSHHSEDTFFGPLLRLLTQAGSRIVLIDAPQDAGVPYSVGHLQRPFSGIDLSRLLS